MSFNSTAKNLTEVISSPAERSEMESSPHSPGMEDSASTRTPDNSEAKNPPAGNPTPSFRQKLWLFICLVGRKARRAIGISLRGLTLLWLIIHFTLTALYLMPVNPIKWSTRVICSMTIGLFFPQNWSLFAPNPAASDMSLLIMPLTEAQAGLARVNGLPREGWYDVTRPLWLAYQKNRFSAYDRLARPQSNALRSYLGGAPSEWADACKKGDKESCKFADQQTKMIRKLIEPSLVKIASGFCKELAPADGQKYTYVAVRFRDRKAVPWSKRYTHQPEVRDFDLFVRPIVADAPVLGLFTRETPIPSRETALSPVSIAPQKGESESTPPSIATR